jgi:diguanylate cyclase (GGDEF)-like protein
MWLHEDGGTTLRFALSLGFCILVVNIILNVLDAVHRRLLSLSVIDPLTGAFNRRHMEEALGLALERRARNGAPASMLLVDVDHFKSINDRFGHASGDHVLRDLVRLLRERSRRLDSVFRIGGEEFVVLLPDTRGHEAVMAAEYLRMHVASHCRAGGDAVTVSIGVAEARPGDDADAWIRRADTALYRAKREGRNRAIAA